MSDLPNRYRYHNEHQSFLLPPLRPTHSHRLPVNTKDVKSIQHHQYKNMYNICHMFRATQLQETAFFFLSSILFSPSSGSLFTTAYKEQMGRTLSFTSNVYNIH